MKHRISRDFDRSTK